MVPQKGTPVGNGSDAIAFCGTTAGITLHFNQSTMRTITLNKGGTAEKTIPVSKLVIPDLWHVAQIEELKGYTLAGKPVGELILECWHIAHDLKRELQALP